jgi:predicted O-methyltransferase YrrM
MEQLKTFRKKGSDQERGLLELTEKLPDHTIMIEIGSAFGESASVFLASGKVDKIYCIDPFGGEGREHFFDERHSKDPRIVKLKYKSEDIVDQFSDEAFDFVYIDAVHTYDGASTDIKNYLPKVKIGGFIGGQDYSHSFLGVIKAVFEKFTFPDYVFRDSSWLVKKTK